MIILEPSRVLGTLIFSLGSILCLWVFGFGLRLFICLCHGLYLQCEPTLLPEPNHVMLNHLYALSIKVSVARVKYIYIYMTQAENFTEYEVLTWNSEGFFLEAYTCNLYTCMIAWPCFLKNLCRVLKKYWGCPEQADFKAHQTSNKGKQTP